MNYNLFHSEDFAADESFIAYCYKTDIEAISFWTDWIAHHPEKLDEIYNAERLLLKLSLRLDEQELQHAFLKFDQFISQEAAPNFKIQKNKKTFVNVKNISIALAFCLILSFFSYQFYQTHSQEVTYLTAHNGDGKITEFNLSDGTKVFLNCNSTIKYPKVFSGNKREVFLSGEAFFEVVRNENKPFTVLAKGTKTVVLGTKFNVSAYQNTQNISIALVEGKVEVQTEGGRDKMILKPKEMASYQPKYNTLTRSIINTATVTSWRTGSIIFESASFNDIEVKLKNIYGIQLVDETKGLKWNYSGQFEKTDYLTIIKNICYAKKINYKQKNQTFILTN